MSCLGDLCQSQILIRVRRLAKGYRPYSGKDHYGCMPYWVINGPGHSPRGAPVDIIYFTTHKDGTRTLEVPSSGISLKRVSYS